MIQIDRPGHRVVRRSTHGAPPDSIYDFKHVIQVGAFGPPKSHLSLYLQLSDGRTIELGYAATADMANTVTRAVSDAVGCPVGCPVRVSTRTHQLPSEGATAWMDVINRFDDHLREPSEASTLEVEIADIVSALPRRHSVRVSEPMEPDPAEGTQPDLMRTFDSACADLLAAYNA